MSSLFQAVFLGFLRKGKEAKGRERQGSRIKDQEYTVCPVPGGQSSAPPYGHTAQGLYRPVGSQKSFRLPLPLGGEYWEGVATRLPLTKAGGRDEAVRYRYMVLGGTECSEFERSEAETSYYEPGFEQ